MKNFQFNLVYENEKEYHSQIKNGKIKIINENNVINQITIKIYKIYCKFMKSKI